MIAALRRRLRERRAVRHREHDGIPRGAGWDRLRNDPTLGSVRGTADNPIGESTSGRARRRR